MKRDLKQKRMVSATKIGEAWVADRGGGEATRWKVSKDEKDRAEMKVARRKYERRLAYNGKEDAPEGRSTNT